MKNNKAAATNNGLTNPMIIFDSNQGLRMSDYAQIPANFQSQSVDDFTIQKLVKLGYWKDRNNFHSLIIEKRNCQRCRQFLKYQGYGNLQNYLAFGICTKCGHEKLFEHLSDISSSFLHSLSIERSIS